MCRAQPRKSWTMDGRYVRDLTCPANEHRKIVFRPRYINFSPTDFLIVSLHIDLLTLELKPIHQAPRIGSVLKMVIRVRAMILGRKLWVTSCCENMIYSSGDLSLESREEIYIEVYIYKSQVLKINSWRKKKKKSALVT